ncbi:MAG: Gfo/Idh/MocA family oxidoreductase [Chromatiales bacterium]|nr:Gfo/Idh/MocA family oxidoreductase [Chromatiales bacterium]
MTPLRLAVIGVGLIGRRHLNIAAKEPECTVVAAADPMAAAREHVEAQGAKFYQDHQDLLTQETLDGVIIATPNATHGPVGIDCAHAGLPMLVEKPFTDTLETGHALLEAADRAGVAIAVGHHRRFDPTVELAKAMLEEGQLGSLTALQFIWALRKHDSYFDTTWRTVRPGGGPGLINLIHDIDLMRHLGGDITRVYAELGHDARGFEVEDVIAATLRFKSGAVGTIITSDATPSPWGWEQGSGENPDVPQTERNCYRLLGTEGALSLPRLELWQHKNGAGGNWHEHLKSTSFPHAPRAALKHQLTHFCAVVRGEVAPRVSGPDGLATLAATAAITQSGETGEVVGLA